MRKSLRNGVTTKNSTKVEVSVVIVNYNTGKLLTECVSSVFKTTQSLKSPKTEIVVVDNASKDDSVDRLLEKDIPLTLVKNRKNEGFAKAVNKGIRKSEGKYKLFLNPDTKVEENAISALVEFADGASPSAEDFGTELSRSARGFLSGKRKIPPVGRKAAFLSSFIPAYGDAGYSEMRNKKEDAGAVGARLLNPDATAQPSVYHFPTLLRAFREFWLGQKGTYEKYLPKSNFPTEVDAVVGAAFLITPKALEKVGFLNERFFMFFEDLDYCRRVKKAGLKVYYLPQARVLHYHGVSGERLAEREKQWQRLVPSSKIYHGTLKHYLINLVIWSGQKWRKFLAKG